MQQQQALSPATNHPPGMHDPFQPSLLRSPPAGWSTIVAESPAALAGGCVGGDLQALSPSVWNHGHDLVRPLDLVPGFPNLWSAGQYLKLAVQVMNHDAHTVISGRARRTWADVAASVRATRDFEEDGMVTGGTCRLRYEGIMRKYRSDYEGLQLESEDECIDNLNIVLMQLKNEEEAMQPAVE